MEFTQDESTEAIHSWEFEAFRIPEISKIIFTRDMTSNVLRNWSVRGQLYHYGQVNRQKKKNTSNPKPHKIKVPYTEQGVGERNQKQFLWEAKGFWLPRFLSLNKRHSPLALAPGRSHPPSGFLRCASVSGRPFP